MALPGTTGAALVRVFVIQRSGPPPADVSSAPMSQGAVRTAPSMSPENEPPRSVATSSARSGVDVQVLGARRRVGEGEAGERNRVQARLPRQRALWGRPVMSPDRLCWLVMATSTRVIAASTGNVEYTADARQART